MPVRSRLWSVLRGLTRIALLASALLCVYFGAASAAFYYHQRERNTVQNLLRLPAAPPPDSTTRLLIFAPHCDDETLGNAGLIQRTLAAGGTVRVVILTNGDGFPAAAAREFRSLRLEPEDYLRFARLRQQESLAALQSLGVSANDVSFCGYPDRGLMPLWNDYWTPGRRYISPTTRRDHADDSPALRPTAAYCGQSLLADIKAAITAFRPTQITVTHPAEDHPDHAAAAAFVTLALQELQAEPNAKAWAAQTQIRYYLIHRGDWPVPPAPNHTDLLPPAAMTHLDTNWTTSPLTETQQARKAHSIALYPSQNAMMRPFLASFARSSEIFGDVPPAGLAVVPDGIMQGNEDAAVWEELAPVLLSPLSDNILREWQGGGDIRACYACRDSRHLYLRIDTRQDIGTVLRFAVRVRLIGAGGESDARALNLLLTPNNAILPNGVREAVSGRSLFLEVPCGLLLQGNTPSPQTLAFSAATELAGVSIDQTGIRLLTM